VAEAAEGDGEERVGLGAHDENPGGGGELAGATGREEFAEPIELPNHVVHAGVFPEGTVEVPATGTGVTETTETKVVVDDGFAGGVPRVTNVGSASLDCP
jgi:hypothetical protein